MPFNEELLEKAAKQMNVQSVVSDFESARAILKQALDVVARQTGKFDPADVDIYLHGSYANKTNIYFPSNLEIMLEVKRTTSYDPFVNPHTKYRLYNNYYVDIMFDFSPADLMSYLFDALQELTGSVCTVGDKSIEIPAGRGIKHLLEITPCFTFNYLEQEAGVPVTNPQAGLGRRSFKGVLLYDRGVSSHIVTFPKLHASNGHAKDLATNGNFLKATRMFKTLNKIGRREADFPKNRGYFIQCLLFNVPNEVYVASSMTGLFYKVLNYFVHADFEGFASQNLVWQLFGDTPEFWNIDAAHRFIKDIKTLHDNFPESRVTLV